MSVDPILRFTAFEVPQGHVLLAATPKGLARVMLGPEPAIIPLLEEVAVCAPSLMMNRGSSLLASVVGSMKRYFLGRRVDFAPVPLDIGPATEFQRAVWRLAATIPYGSVRTYGWLADHLEGRGCARAVGQALARNPVPVVVPCHRVIEESGSWGGFTAGEIWKGILLGIEGGEQRLKLRERRVRESPPSAAGCDDAPEA